MANGFVRTSDSATTTTVSTAAASCFAKSNSSPPKRSQSLSPQRRASPVKSPDTKTSGLPTLPSTASKALRALVRACLQRNPRKRATAAQLTEMDFFQVDAAQATNEMLRTVCTDLDASMKRLMSSSSPSSESRRVSSASSGGGDSRIRSVPARPGSALVSPVYSSIHTKARTTTASAASAPGRTSRW